MVPPHLERSRAFIGGAGLSRDSAMPATPGSVSSLEII